MVVIIQQHTANVSSEQDTQIIQVVIQQAKKRTHQSVYTTKLPPRTDIANTRDPTTDRSHLSRCV